MTHGRVSARKGCAIFRPLVAKASHVVENPCGLGGGGYLISSRATRLRAPSKSLHPTYFMTANPELYGRCYLRLVTAVCNTNECLRYSPQECGP